MMSNEQPILVQKDDDSQNKRKTIGIDFGTNLSEFGVYQENAEGNVFYNVIYNQNGDRTTPCIVVPKKSGDVLIGTAAGNLGVRFHDKCFIDMKRMLGRKFDDPHLQKWLAYWPFKVVPDKNNDPMYEWVYNDKHTKREPTQWQPEQVAARVLKKMLSAAADYIGTSVKRAVVTVPDCYTTA